MFCNIEAGVVDVSSSAVVKIVWNVIGWIKSAKSGKVACTVFSL